ncbi:MAG: SusC/RagA family TonB-linked outer membrane protein [Bacteroidota bacterium]
MSKGNYTVKRTLTFLWMVMLSLGLLAQEGSREVSGTVQDAETGEGLPGVNVIIKGTNQGTVTDLDGNYTITVPGADAVLVYSFVGFAPVEVEVGEQTVIDLDLNPDATGLEEVVIVAYGEQKKSNLTGSVASVNAEAIEKANNSPALTERLKGSAAGVQVISSTSGKPGENASVKIRGNSTLQGSSSPLWVVDGMIFGSAPNLNPDDVESMTVLKDASSTALYGSRAAGGVIMITTKSGKVGKPEFNFSYKKGFSKYNTGEFNVMNSQQLFNHFTSFWAPSYDLKADETKKILQDTNPELSEEEIDALIVSIFGTREEFINDKFLAQYPHLDTCTQLLDVDTDWEEYAFRTGQVDEYNLSYAAKTDKVSTYLSGSYYQEDGILKGQNYSRFTGNANITWQATERLSLNARLNMNYSERLNQDGSSLYNTYIYMPWDDPYNEDGSIREVLNGSSADGRKWYGRDGSNYMYPRQYNYGMNEGLNNRYKVQAIYKITDHLKLEHNQNFNFANSYYFNNADARTSSGRVNDNNGSIYEGYGKSVKYLANTFLRYRRLFNEHDIGITVGYEYENYRGQSLGAVGTGIIPGAIIMNAASSADPNSGYRSEYANQSFLTNVNYVISDKYLFQGSLRYDGSSRFHEDNRYGTFYTLSAGWILTREDFLRDNSVLNFLKLRTSYGSVGNLYPNIYEAYGVYGFGFSYNQVPGLFPSRMSLPLLTWETKNDFNAAADFRLFNRISGTIELYHSTAKNLYGKENLSTLSGFSDMLVNYGGISNRGLEITLNSTLIETEHFRWDLNFNVNFNKNQVERIDDKGREEYDRGNMIWKIGYDSKTFYMREWAGVDPETGDPLYRQLQKDENGNVIKDTVTSDWNYATRLIQDKTGTPKMFGGFGTNVDWRDLSFSMLFYYSYGNYIYYSGMEFFDNDGAYAEYNQMAHGDDFVRWEKPGDIATHPRANYGGNKLSNKTTTRYLHDGSYLKLGNISLSYRINDLAFLDRIGVREITLTASADNLYTFTRFPGVNPEVHSYAGASIAPNIRKYLFGINLRF